MACEYYKNCPGYDPSEKKCFNPSIQCDRYDAFIIEHDEGRRSSDPLLERTFEEEPGTRGKLKNPLKKDAASGRNTGADEHRIDPHVL